MSTSASQDAPDASRPDDAGRTCATPQRRGFTVAGRLLILTAVLVGTLLLGISTGAVDMSLGQALTVLGAEIGLDLPWAYERVQQLALVSVRLPRVLLGVLCGAALGASGAALQGMFRNPLADPGLIGVSSGAALGALTAIYLTETVFELAAGIPPDLVIPIAAFAGALLVTWIVFRLATRAGHTSVATMLLAGIAINAAAGAAIGFISHFSEGQRLRALVLWTLGSLGGANWRVLAICAPLVLVTLAPLLWRTRSLDALLLGEREAHHLGVDVHRLRLLIIVGSALAVGAAVAFCGPIGFVGLVAPHIVRLLFGPSHRTVLPGAALLGAALVVGADVVARTVLSPAELPIGIVTAAVGAPFFLALLLARRDREVI